MNYANYPDEPRSANVAATLIYIMMGPDALAAFVKQARNAKWVPGALTDKQRPPEKAI